MKKKTWSIVLTLCLGLSLSLGLSAVIPLPAGAETEVWDGAPATADPDATFSGGTGLAGAPYQIRTAEEFALLAANVNAGTTYSGVHFKLTDDIVLNADAGDYLGWEATPPANTWTPIGDHNDHGFFGVFDGGGHTVSGMYMNDNLNYRGLFGFIGSGGVVQNVGVTDSFIINSFPPNGYVGGVVGISKGAGAIIQYCYNTGSINANEAVGGVAGHNEGTVRYSYNTGVMSNGHVTGGVVGLNSGGTIENCYNTAAVGYDQGVGGVVGYNQNGGTVQYCYNTGVVNANLNKGSVTGGNYTGSTMRYCYWLAGSAAVGLGGGEGTKIHSFTAAEGQGADLLNALNAVSPGTWDAAPRR